MLDILKKYDVFLVDAYGVFWDGRDFISGTKEMLHALVQQGKIVIILSNTTQRAATAMEKYSNHGLLKNIHYHGFVTSGEVLRQELEKGLTFGEGDVKNYYSFGTENLRLFEGLHYVATSLAEADFIYIGIPQITSVQKQAMAEERPLYAAILPQEGKEMRWDTTDIEVFSPLLSPLLATSLPVLNANPDITALEKCYITNHTHAVIRQGAIARKLEEGGMNVRQFGKPYGEVYTFCRNLLIEEFGITPTDMETLKTVMIGDTVGTDIAGAHHATHQLGWPIDGILTLTGNAAEGFGAITAENAAIIEKHLQTQYQAAGCSASYVITSFGIEGKEVFGHS